MSASTARPHDLVWRSIVWAGTAIFAAVHTGLIVSRFHRFGVYTFDFGIFDQGLWLLSRLEDPFVTLRGLNLFADHSSYIMVLLVPLYWVWADPRLLMTVTVIAISLSAPLLYGIGRRIGIRPPLAGLVSLAFLVHPAVRWATWDNFHPEVFVLPLLLGATVFVLDRKPWWAVLFAGLALMTKEDAALLVVPFGLWVAFAHRERPTGLTIAGLGVASFALNFRLLLPFFSPTDAVLYSGRYAEYGRSAFGVMVGVLTSPAAVLDDLVRPETIAYLRDMVGVAPTSLAAPFVLALGLPITLANMLSTHIYQVDIRYHYTVYLLTAVGLAAVFGARRLQVWAAPGRLRAVAGVVIVAALAGLVPGPGNPAWGGREEAAALEDALDLIGPGDIVSANSTVAVHLAHRRTIYRFPNPFRELDYGAPGVPYAPSADEVEWVVLDPSRLDNFAFGAETLAALRRSGEWVTIADTDGVVLLRRRQQVEQPEQ